MPREAEAWLAERGIRREPIRVSAEPSNVTPDDRRPAPVSSREVLRLATQSAVDTGLGDADARAHPDPSQPHLEEDVAQAVAFVRRSTSVAPQSEGRLRDKLRERGWPAAVIERTIERARRERLVDDVAMAAALVAERRAKGHATVRIRRDLRDRGFGEDVLDSALASAEAEDPHAAAFAVAHDKAAALTGVQTETAYRRVAAFVARRGYPEALARKVARDAVFATRDPERTAGH